MYIYKTTNLINGKIYVGKSSKSISESTSYYGSGIIFFKALKKYGKENFKKEIIEELESIEEMNNREKYWIETLNAQDSSIGYNLANGGDGGDTSSFIDYSNPEYKKKLSDAQSGEKNSQYGKKHTKKELINRKFIKYGKDNHMTGRKQSDEFKKRVSEANKGSGNGNYGKVWCVEETSTNKSGRKMFLKDNIPDGWITCVEFDNMKKDRNAPAYGRSWYNDGIKNYLKYPKDSIGLNKGRITTQNT